MIGSRLQVARMASGLSLRQLSDRVDKQVSAQAISNYEHDKSMPSSDALIQLADKLGVSTDFFFGDTSFAVEHMRFREKDRASDKEIGQIKTRVLDYLEKYLLLEEVLGLSSVSWNYPIDFPWPVYEVSEADHSARMLRETWKLGLDPVQNMAELLEMQGVKVLFMNLVNIHGLTAFVRVRDGLSLPVFVVNENDCGERKRLTMAQELGHLMLEVIPSDLEEKAVDRFAGALLIPAEIIRQEVGKRRKNMEWRELFELKQFYGISVQALIYRCKDLNIFGNRLFKYLVKEYSRRQWCSTPCNEPFPVRCERPARFERLCARALSENAISESKAAELLGVSVFELSKKLDV